MTRRRRSTGKETSPTPSSRRRSAKRNVMRMHLRPSSCGSATATPRTPPTGTVSRPASSATAACSPCPPASAGAILPPETATPWPHSTVTIRQRVHALLRRPGRTTGTAPLLRHPGRTGETLPAPHAPPAARTVRHRTALSDTAPRPCIASTFLFRIGGEEIRCTLRRIEGYDPRPPRPAAPSPVCPTDSPSTVLHPRGPQPYDSPHSHGMHSSKIRPTLLPERGRRETATIPPTANPIPNAGERAGKNNFPCNPTFKSPTATTPASWTSKG